MFSYSRKEKTLLWSKTQIVNKQEPLTHMVWTSANSLAVSEYWQIKDSTRHLETSQSVWQNLRSLKAANQWQLCPLRQMPQSQPVTSCLAPEPLRNVPENQAIFKHYRALKTKPWSPDLPKPHIGSDLALFGETVPYKHISLHCKQTEFHFFCIR